MLKCWTLKWWTLYVIYAIYIYIYMQLYNELYMQYICNISIYLSIYLLIIVYVYGHIALYRESVNEWLTGIKCPVPHHMMIDILINNDKIISLNRRIEAQSLFNISNELFCFSNELSEITAFIIKLHLHL